MSGGINGLDGRVPSAPGSREPSREGVSAAVAASIPSRSTLRSLYSPEHGRIACVLLQAAYGGSREPCRWFDDWETGRPDKTYGWIDLTREEWRHLGMLSREARVSAWRSHRDSAVAQPIAQPSPSGESK